MYLCKLLPSAKRCPREKYPGNPAVSTTMTVVSSPGCSVEPPRQAPLAILSPDWTS